MKFKSLCITSAVTIFLIYSSLILSLLFFLKGDLFYNILFSSRTLFSIKLSLICATAATGLSIVLAIPAAYALSRFNFKGKLIIDTILELPMVLSPAALGAMLLIFFNNPIGRWISAHQVQFVFTFYGIILAQFITTLGISTRLVKMAIDEVPIRLEQVANTLGSSPIKTFFTITLPLSKKGILAATILTWAKALGEFGATITIGGSMAKRTETIPIAIFTQLSSANIESAVVLIMILILMGLTILYFVKIKLC